MVLAYGTYAYPIVGYIRRAKCHVLKGKWGVKIMIISIAEKFSRFPAGRHPGDGPFNAERFRREILTPALRQVANSSDKVVVELDGVAGYSSSFLEEAFGGLVRDGQIPTDTIRSKLSIVAKNSIYEAARLDAQRYLDEALHR